MGCESDYTAGYRVYQWIDASRRRPVWVDAWYPADKSSSECRISYGSGEGSAAVDARVSSGEPFPVALISHGAFGSAPNYGWLAERLARSGVVVVGVSHYGESWRYGPDAIDPVAATRLWTRPTDCTFALDQFLTLDEFKGRVDATRIAAIGHSSGGATAVALGGATFDPLALRSYCQSEAARNDRGCQYGNATDEPSLVSPETIQAHRDSRFKALVLLDPAAGPGYSESSLANVDLPVLVIGCEDNDFLPFEHHAGRYAELLPNASLIRLTTGEGHFVFLNSCASDLSANGVRLFVDRAGVDRRAVHARLAPMIFDFLRTAMSSAG